MTALRVRTMCDRQLLVLARQGVDGLSVADADALQKVVVGLAGPEGEKLRAVVESLGPSASYSYLVRALRSAL